MSEEIEGRRERCEYVRLELRDILGKKKILAGSATIAEGKRDICEDNSATMLDVDEAELFNGKINLMGIYFRMWVYKLIITEKGEPWYGWKFDDDTWGRDIEVRCTDMSMIQLPKPLLTGGGGGETSVCQYEFLITKGFEDLVGDGFYRPGLKQHSGDQVRLKAGRILRAVCLGEERQFCITEFAEKTKLDEVSAEKWRNAGQPIG